MRAFSKFLLIFAITLLGGLIGFSENVSAKTCLHSECSQKCYSGDRYCYKHRINTTTKKKSKKTNKTNNSRLSTMKKTGPYNNSKTANSYSVDDMPDCDDYGSWGEFMDDWDGNMPDGSDASDYWDNW